MIQRKLEDEYNELLKAYIQQGLNYRELEIERDTLKTRLAEVEKDDREVRRMLCVAHSPRAYMDDGEASDASVHPFIDYLRDTPDQIRNKWAQRIANMKEQP